MPWKNERTSRRSTTDTPCPVTSNVQRVRDDSGAMERLSVAPVCHPGRQSNQPVGQWCKRARVHASVELEMAGSLGAGHVLRELYCRQAVESLLT